MFLDLLDPDPLDIGTDLDQDASTVSSSKIVRKTLIPTVV